MNCNVIEECRCFAYSDVTDPKQVQFCGVRKGPKVLPCPSGCCSGGCPGDFPKEPFRIIDRPTYEIRDSKTQALLILIAISLVILLYAMT
jgi:hypothetical protein